MIYIPSLWEEIRMYLAERLFGLMLAVYPNTASGSWELNTFAVKWLTARQNDAESVAKFRAERRARRAR